VINLHLVFNLAVAVLGLPLVPLLMAGAGRVLPAPPAAPAVLERQSALDPAARAVPERALASAARAVLHMGEAVEAMLRPALRLYESWDEATARSIRQAEARLDAMHFDTKRYLAGLDGRAMDEAQTRRSAELVDLAAHLEAAGDAIARDMLGLARKMHAENLRFSPAGRRELQDFHDRVLANVQASLNVQMSQDPEAARALVAEKERVRDAEQGLQRAHLERLRQGNPDSFATSNIHQETLRALKQINTALTMAAYPILTETGDLLASRLTGTGREDGQP
jgi:phosphate:Na+ symporter